MEQLVAVILICHAVDFGVPGKCDYQHAVEVHRLAAGPPPVGPAGMPHTHDCHVTAATASRRYHAELGDIVTWQCIPASEADAAGLK